MFTWETNRLMAPFGLGQSGLSSSRNEQNKPSDWASITSQVRGIR
jgi:hypothetical protein